MASWATKYSSAPNHSQIFHHTAPQSYPSIAAFFLVFSLGAPRKALHRAALGAALSVPTPPPGSTAKASAGYPLLSLADCGCGVLDYRPQDTIQACHPEGNCHNTDPCGMTASGGAQKNPTPTLCGSCWGLLARCAHLGGCIVR